MLASADHVVISGRTWGSTKKEESYAYNEANADNPFVLAFFSVNEAFAAAAC